MFKWKLRACRVQAGLYQREAAKALGISEVSLVNYEKGKSSPDMDLGQQSFADYVGKGTDAF